MMSLAAPQPYIPVVRVAPSYTSSPEAGSSQAARWDGGSQDTTVIDTERPSPMGRTLGLWPMPLVSLPRGPSLSQDGCPEMALEGPRTCLDISPALGTFSGAGQA